MFSFIIYEIKKNIENTDNCRQEYIIYEKLYESYENKLPPTNIYKQRKTRF